jgi:PHD/YefM family antitoxin component YafN of YafNO toxin-antitoxin module
MSVNELKEKLHQEIDALEDPAALQLLHEAASEFAKATRPDILDLLTPEQMERLDKSIGQADAGNTISHTEVMQKIAQWRSK